MNLVSGAMKDDEKIHLNEETKKLILESVGHLDLIGLFSFITHLHEQEITHTAFPEVWELIAEKLIKEADYVHINI